MRPPQSSPGKVPLSDTAGTSRPPTLLAGLFQLKPRDVPVRVAARNTAAVVLPLVLGILSDHVGVGLGISVGALNSMFTDQPGPYRLRMQRMLLAALASGVAAFVGSVLGATTWALALAAVVTGVAGGMLVALGPNAGRAGLTAMIMLVISAAMPRSPLAALGPAALFVAGGLLQMLVAIAAWPLQRYRPEREALATLCRQLAATARDTDDTSYTPPATQALLDSEDLLHGAHRARGRVMETFRVLAALFERSRLELLALRDVRDEIGDADLRHTLTRLLDYAARALDGLADALASGVSGGAASAAIEGFESALGSLRRAADDAHDARLLGVAHARAEGLAGQLRAAIRNAEYAGSRGELRAVAAEQRLPAALRPRSHWQILRANVGLSSIAFRHALRCGVCLAIAIVGERVVGIGHGYWIPMTAAIVLKPDFAGTFSFGLLRVAGTMLGLVLVTALVHFAFAGVWERVVLLAAFAFGFRLLTTVHYGIGVMLLTGLVVLLFSFEGVAPGDVLAARGAATAIGSGLALLAYLLWPTWEQGRVRPALTRLLEAYRDYLATLLDANAADRRDAVRRAARVARTNVQASLDRLRGEPRRDTALIALAETVFATANRCVRAGMSLEAATLGATALPERERVAAFLSRVCAVLERISASVRDGTPLPAIDALRADERQLASALDTAAGGGDLRGSAIAEALDRLTDSVDTLAAVVGKAASRRTVR